MEHKSCVTLQMDHLPVVNYAIQQNKLPLIRSLTVENTGDEPLEQVRLTLSSEPGFCVARSREIAFIPAGSKLEVSDLEPELDGGFLASFTEKISGVLVAELSKEGESLAVCRSEVTVLAFDQWPGDRCYPELLAAFVTPNHPELNGLLCRAAGLLAGWTGDPSLTGYQSKDPDRVLKQAAAIYGALQEQKLIYANPPASFEGMGQRVRLCDQVLGGKLGTCLDLTVLFASCLEACGLHPILVVQSNHAFAGLWLEDQTFLDPIQYDGTLLTKRMAEGVNQIIVFETTCVTDGKNMSFDRAREAGEKKLAGEDPILYVVDVRRARLSHILPLPQRVQTDGGWEVRLEKPASVSPDAPRELGAQIDTEAGEELTGKMAQWERKLLDLGLRNTLINMRLSRNILPILTSSLDELEDALSGGGEFRLTYRPAEWTAPNGEVSFETVHLLGNTQALIQSEFKNRRLRSALGEAETLRVSKELYRASRVSLEENGANTLYLAMGLLRWYETERKSAKARYAPMILVPVELIRQAGNQGYLLRLRDDEAQINVTMLEKLKQEFGIHVRGLDPLPTDERGIDTRKVFTILRKAIMEQKRWDLLESAWLGIFSFTQFVMWNDVRNRGAALLQNKIVSSLVEGRLTWEPGELTPPDRIDESESLLPLPADASQLYAIQVAARGESFVLHGPPGTGKSQTITALIANALAQGKTVLFVAEKMAALEVVRHRLEQIGLGPFCLELHSNKSRKKNVLEQLRRAAEVTRRIPPEEFERRAEQLAALRAEMDAYAGALHEKQVCGMTLFELMDGYEASKQAEELPMGLSGAEQWTADLLERQKLLLGRLLAAADIVGPLEEHPLREVRGTRYTQQLRMELPMLLEEYRKAIEEYRRCVERFDRLLGRTTGTDGSSLAQCAELAAALQRWEGFPAEWNGCDDLEVRLKGLEENLQLQEYAESLKGKILRKWDAEFLSLDGAGLTGRCRQAANSWFLPKLLGMNELKRLLAPYAKEVIDKEQLGDQLSLLAEYQRKRQQAREGYALWGKGLSGDPEERQSRQTLREQIAAVRENRKQLARIPGGEDAWKKAAGQPETRSCLAGLQTAWQLFTDRKKQIYDLLGLTELTAAPDWMDAEEKRLEVIKGNSAGLKDWMAWNAARKEAEDAGLAPAIQAAEQGMEREKILPAWQKAFCRTLAVSIIDSSPVLSTFSGAVFNEKVRQFRELDETFTQLTREELYCRLASRVPNFTREAAQSSELGKLQKAVRSNGRGISIRKLFEQLPNLLTRICPCMLMSPISVAQYLDPEREPFDLVVFDEASQIPTCKAVGALARGNEAVIVGDPNQMPPTSFFMTSAADEDNPDLEDLESILEDCLALNLPQTHLRWHYRSRHESLIAFSNDRFYDGKLYTFPSADDGVSKVSLVRVDGVFDRGSRRQNRAEAEAVIEEIRRRAADPELSSMSLGVVTFNIGQQNLIDDLLSEACAADPALERWAYHGDEPVFIKNLENVQGDERDVILFSVGYGPDQSGKIFMNFGPLNRDGGWRRLNVAVSRARREMKVFTSLAPEQIDLSRTAARGVAELRRFLEYAGGKALNVTEEGAAAAGRQAEAVSREICRGLAEAGYTARTSIGHSAYRIDIGVEDPEEPGRYLLGILLDGQSYGDARTTRDRELAQISVLEGLGWKLHRIWSMDWWENSALELARLLAVLEQRRQEKDRPEPEDGPLPEGETPEEEPAEEPLPEEDAPRSLSGGPQPYRSSLAEWEKLTADAFVLPEQTEKIENALLTILEQEAPICQSLLTKKTLQSFGIARAGNRILSRMEELYAELDLLNTEHEGQRIFWSHDQDPERYHGFRMTGEGADKREVKDLPVHEAANAICYVLLDQMSMIQSDLIRESSRLLGYGRVTGNVNETYTRAIGFALARGWLEIGGHQTWQLTDEGVEYAGLLEEESRETCRMDG